VSAGESSTQISAGHPLRDIDDLVIDHDFQAGQMSVLDLPNDPPLPAEQGV